MCQSASRVKLIRGLSSTSKVENLWTTRLGTAYDQSIPFSLIAVGLCAMQNSSHLIASLPPDSRIADAAERVHPKKVIDHAVLRSDLRSQKS